MSFAVPVDVLIVDDSAAIRRLLQWILRETDLPLGDIFEACDGAEAVDILNKRQFGLVLSDINMPQMDGLQLLAHIKQMDNMKTVPVIMISTEGSQETVTEAVQLGAAGYVSKPFTPDQIRKQLAAVLT